MSFSGCQTLVADPNGFATADKSKSRNVYVSVFMTNHSVSSVKNEMW